jgi:hypothetical protein
MTLLALNFNGSPRLNRRHRHVRHDNLGVVVLPPFNDEFLVEPLVKSGNKVVPLQDPQDFWSGASRREGGHRRSRTCGRQEKSSRSTYCHGNFSGLL